MLTEQEEIKLRELLAARQTAKRINQLPRATGRLSDMAVPVTDESGETRQMNLAEAVETAGNPMAGRYWNEGNSTPTAAGYYGSLSALRDLPKKMGFGRYLVTDDRVRRKLDPTDSRRFEDGTPARLDGSMGQCMWGWNDHYYSTWREGNNTVEVITFQPIPGKKSVFVPAGGLSWFNAGVIDRVDNILCSLISEDERYRGGNNVVRPDTYPLAVDAPQKTMLGMAATAYRYDKFSEIARKRGEGWDANWFVARAVVEYSLRIILGTRNSQAAYNPELDANGLYQGGLGFGVLGITSKAWEEYNGYYPLLPTSVGLEMGDGVGVVEYSVTKDDGTSVYKAPVPVFFGLVNPFGHLWASVSGLVYEIGAEKSLAWIAPSLYAGHSWINTEGMLLAAEMPRAEGYIKRISMNHLACAPTETGASNATCYCDHFWTNVNAPGFRVRLCGGSAHHGTGAGAFCSHADHAATGTHAYGSSPLCYFERDPVMKP